jgi:hypothetical protein
MIHKNAHSNRYPYLKMADEISTLDLETAMGRNNPGENNK